MSLVVSEDGAERVYPSDEPLDKTTGFEMLHWRNLLVVRESETDFVSRKSSAWARWWDILRQNLSGIEGGLHRIQARIFDRVGLTPKGEDWVNREGRRLKDEVEKMRSDLRYFDALSSQIFELDRLMRLKKKLQSEEERLTAELETLKKLKKKRIYQRAKREMETLSQLREEEKRYGLVDRRDFERWREIEARIVSLSDSINQMMQQYQGQERELKRKEEMAAQLRMQAAEWERREIEIVPEIEKRLKNLRALHMRKQTTARWQPLVSAGFFASCAVMLLFLALAFFRSPLFLVGAGISLVSAICLYVSWYGMRALASLMDAAKVELFQFFEKMGEVARDVEEAERWLEVGRSTARENRAKAELLFMEVARERAQFEQMGDSISSKRVLLEEVRAEMEALKRKTGVPSLKELQLQIESLAQVRQKIEAHKRLLSEYLGTNNETEFYAKLAQFEGYEDVEGEYDEERFYQTEKREEEVRREKEEVTRQVSEMEKQFARFGLSSSEELWTQKEKIRKRLEQLEIERRGALLAARIITDLAESQDALINSIMGGSTNSTSAIFSELTNGTYSGVFWKEDTIYVERPSGAVIPSDMLSSGTRVQLYFALRLALLHKLLKGKKIFLLLDDPFLSADSRRLSLLLDSLLKLSKSGWQILYFTVDRDIADWALAHHLEGVTLHHLPPLFH
ncbi:MAG: hypothetical protein N2234_09055 [Planctomycetota bacterium]|nr:hypothetical protein [Planctomycetota bacterium]